VLVKGHFVNQPLLSLLDVDLVVITTAYLLAFFGRTGAGIFAFGQGLLIDIFSAGLSGVFTFLYLVIFFGLQLGARLLDLGSVMGQIILVSLAVLLKQIIFVGILGIFSFETRVTSHVFFAFATSSLFSGLIAPFLFSLFNHLSRPFVKAPVNHL
jgi:rod shape-determining protein MreD